MVDFVPLKKMTTGQFAEVLSLEGDASHVHRLGELGFRQGTRIEIFRGGNPCIVRSRGNKLCLRTDQLLNVLVKPIEKPL